MNSFLLIGTFISLAISIYFSAFTENIIALICILSIGILHGANDLILIDKRQDTKGSKKYTRLFYYLLVIVTTAMLFYLIPGIALAVFVIFSAYHFGEQHWKSRFQSRKTLDSLFFVIYGLFIFFLIFDAHSHEVSQIMGDITAFAVPQSLFRPVLIGLTIPLGFLFVVYGFKDRWNTSWIKEIFYLLVFYIVFNAATLLWAFAIYFVFWHSLPSLKDQVVYLYGTFNKGSILRYVKSALLYWISSVIALGVFIYFFKENETALLALFFSFLAAITFPHVLVIMGMHKGVNKEMRKR